MYRHQQLIDTLLTRNTPDPSTSVVNVGPYKDALADADAWADETRSKVTGSSTGISPDAEAIREVVLDITSRTIGWIEEYPEAFEDAPSVEFFSRRVAALAEVGHAEIRKEEGEVGEMRFYAAAAANELTAALALVAEHSTKSTINVAATTAAWAAETADLMPHIIDDRFFCNACKSATGIRFGSTYHFPSWARGNSARATDVYTSLLSG